MNPLKGIQDKAKNDSTLQQALDVFQVVRKIFERYRKSFFKNTSYLINYYSN